jgi:hypothetical protein
VLISFLSESLKVSQSTKQAEDQIAQYDRMHE